MYQAKSGVKNFSLYLGGGGPLTKKFLPVWTCTKPNLVSKIFPFTWGGGSLDKKFFASLNMYQAKSGVKNFSLYWDQVPPPPDLRLGTPPRTGPGTPPGPPWTPRTWTWDPPTSTWTWDPPLSWVWTDKLKTVPSPILRMRAVTSENIACPRTWYVVGNKFTMLNYKIQCHVFTSR